MATNLDFARELAAAADRDLLVLRKLVPDRDIPHAPLGQQHDSARGHDRAR